MLSSIKNRLVAILGNENALFQRGRILRRKLARTDERIRNAYLASAVDPKLQIGGGWCRKDGWLNTDLERLPGTMYMDATRRFPFEDGTFQYVYCEHMIEHVTYEDAAFMLTECWRVLRPSGTIRIVTPDFGAMIGLYSDVRHSTQSNYLDYFCTAHLPKTRPANAVAVINGQMRMWGHQFIYDECTLTRAMAGAGFRSINRKRLGESDHNALLAIDNETRYPPGLLDFESLTLEANR